MTVRQVARLTAKYGLGYVIACLAAGLSGAVTICATDDTISLADLPLGVLFVAWLAFLTAWTGFLPMMVVAAKFQWSRSIHFTLAGCLTALAALLTIAMQGAGDLFELILPGVIGGAAGGYAYGKFVLSRTFAGT